MIRTVCLLMLLGVIVRGQITVTITTNNPSSSTYNVGEKLQISCVFKNNSVYISPRYKLHWYKEQGKDAVAVSSDGTVTTTFTGANYVVTSPDSPADNEVVTQLTIESVTATEAGTYKCKGGKQDGITEEEMVEIKINPAPATVVLTTDAPMVNSMYEFNGPYQVMCTSTVSTSQTDVMMKILLNDKEISQKFGELGNIFSWTGTQEGLKIPQQTLSYSSDWEPDQSGDGTLHCKVIHEAGPLVLGTSSFNFTKDAPDVTLKCESNYNKPVKEGDLDVYITCKPIGSEKDVMYAVEYTYVIDGEVKTLTTGEKDKQRDWSAKKDNGKFILHIPRVTSDMTLLQGNSYNITLKKINVDDSEEELYTVSDFTIDVIATKGGSTNDSAVTCSITFSLLIVATIVSKSLSFML